MEENKNKEVQTAQAGMKQKDMELRQTISLSDELMAQVEQSEQKCKSTH